MRRSVTPAALLALAVLTLPSPAADSTPAAPKTLMTVPGKVIVSDSLAGGLPKQFKVAKGKWEAADGATRGAELKSDMHGAVARMPLNAKDVIIRYSFKVDGAKVTTLSINDAKGHCCRAIFRPTTFAIQKDDHDHDGPDKAVPFGSKEVTLKPGEWHTVVIELRGPEMLATLDGTHTLYGSHDALNLDKANFGFTVAGETASFKDLTVWEATPAKEWDSSKYKGAKASK